MIKKKYKGQKYLQNKEFEPFAIKKKCWLKMEYLWSDFMTMTMIEFEFNF